MTQAELHARQEPRIRVMPDGGAYSDGEDCARLCTYYWFTPDPWQEGVMVDLLTRRADGELFVISAGLSAPRQNGKNGIIEGIEFYLLVTDPNTHILHTAHNTKTAQKAFERMCRNFTKPTQKHEEILALVDKKNGGRIRYANGEQGIYLSNGASIEYITRTNAGGRGFDGITLLIYDEAQELTSEHVQALSFTISASKGDQLIIYAGTPPNERAAGTVFTSLRDAAISGEAGERASWHEWSVEQPPPDECDFDHVRPLLYEANPSLELDRPGHLREETCRQEFNAFRGDLLSYWRERLGYWEKQKTFEAAIKYKDWAALEDKNPPALTGSKRTVGVKFSLDGRRVAVVTAFRHGRGKPHLQVMEYADISGAGTRPLAEALYRIRNKVALVVIDGPAGGALADNLKALNYPKNGYSLARPGDVAAAAAGLIDSIREKSFAHYGQEQLNESAQLSVRRPIGNKASGAYGFGGSSPEPLEAAALALRALKTTKRNPARRANIYF